MKRNKNQQLNQLLILIAIIFCVIIAILFSVVIKYKGRFSVSETCGIIEESFLPKTESADTTEKPFNSVSAKENESVYSKEQTGSGLKGYGDDGKKISDENLTYKGMLININSATKEEFLLLDGIDNDLAGAIISYREENGGFIRPEDLLNVPGMTREILKNIYSYLLW